MPTSSPPAPPASTASCVRPERSSRATTSPRKRGRASNNPCAPHEHWHVDVTYINVAGTFFYLCSLLDGYSRFIVHWEIRESMTEPDVETIIQRARERFPDERPRIISDNGPQFIAKDFKEFIRICGMTHVRTSPYYPQSNGKMERWYKTLKGECIRVKTPLSLADARRIVEDFVAHYNTVRLHSAIGYVAPADKLAGRDRQIFAERDRKLDTARERRKAARAASQAGTATDPGQPIARPREGLRMSVARAEDRAPWRHDPSADPGAKTEGGRHDAALSFPFGIGTKAANRPSLFQCALYLISRPWFLHFTLNHHRSGTRS